MSRSSIFSFETLRLSGPRPANFARALLVAVVSVIAAEEVARVVVKPYGRYPDYWDTASAQKFEPYRRAVERGAAPGIVIVGDSTAARDLDPRVIGQMAGTDGYSLAWPGAFALALRDCVLPMLAEGSRPPGTVIAAFSPGAFVDDPQSIQLEAPLRSSVACRTLRGDWHPTTMLALTRLKWVWDSARGAGLYVDKRIDEAGFMPLEGMIPTPAVRESAVRPVWRPIMRERFDALRALARLAGAQRFRLIIVVPPMERPGPYDADYLAALQTLPADTVRVLDYRQPPFLAPDDFYDAMHLNRQGAEKLSRRLAEDLGYSSRTRG
jgi:hypothetical protein